MDCKEEVKRLNAIIASYDDATLKALEVSDEAV